MSRTLGIPWEDRPAPNVEYTPGLPSFDDDTADILTLGQCAWLCKLKPPTIRDAIKRGELAAFIPRGRAPGRTGPGNGYRVFRADLQRWFFRGQPIKARKEDDDG